MPEKFNHLLPTARMTPMSPRRGSVVTSKRFSRVAIVLLVLVVFWLLPKDWIFAGSGAEDGSGAVGAHGSKSKGKASSSAFAKKPLHIITFTTKELSYQYLSHRNKVGYARRHGYDITIDYRAPDPDGVLFHKFGMMEKIIDADTHEWIWWIDFDTLITNMSIPLIDIIHEELAELEKPDDINFMFTADCFELNAGSMITRSNYASRQFLQEVRQYHRKNPKTSEQDAIRDLIRTNQNDCKKQIHYVPQWKINAFPEEIKCWDKHQRGWEPGVFVAHFAGAWAHIKDDDPYGFLMRKYERWINWEGQ